MFSSTWNKAALLFVTAVICSNALTLENPFEFKKDDIIAVSSKTLRVDSASYKAADAVPNKIRAPKLEVVPLPKPLPKKDFSRVDDFRVSQGTNGEGGNDGMGFKMNKDMLKSFNHEGHHDHDSGHEGGHGSEGDRRSEEDEEQGHSHEDKNLRVNQIIAFVVMILVGGLGVAIPYMLKNVPYSQSIVTYSNAFGCGAFLGLSFFHLLPESLTLLNREHGNVGFYVGKGWYNLTFILAPAGFLLILFFEKILVVAFVSSSEDMLLHNHAAETHHHHRHRRISNIPSRSTTTGCSDIDASPLEQVTIELQPQLLKDNISSNKVRPIQPEIVSHQSFCDMIVESSGDVSKLSGCPSCLSLENEQKKKLGVADSGLSHHHKRHKVTSFSVVTLFVTLSLCIHSVFEGLIIGVLHDTTSVWVATISIVGHKWAEGFALATNCIYHKVTRAATIVYFSVFVLSSPVGMLVGMGANSADYKSVGILNAISLGTILYTGCEILFELFGCSRRFLTELLKLLVLLGGAGLVLGLMMVHLTTAGHVH